MNKQEVKNCLLEFCKGHAGHYDGNKLKAEWKNESICLKYCGDTENLKIFKASGVFKASRADIEDSIRNENDTSHFEKEKLDKLATEIVNKLKDGGNYCLKLINNNGFKLEKNNL